MPSIIATSSNAESMAGDDSPRVHGRRDSPRPRRNRLTIRARLALTYALLVTVAGVILLIIMSVSIVLLPSYNFGRPAELIGEPAQSIEESSALPIDESLGITPGESTGDSSGDDSTVFDPSRLVSPTFAVTVSSRDDLLQLILGVSAAAILLFAAGGALAGWIIAGRMLRPLQYVNVAAHQAAAGHLDHRIALRGPRDEITELADTFDNMLGEIERSLDAHRRFAANASHELRTPLATNRAMLDVALSSKKAPHASLLVRLRETNERSIGTVESLLDLAEIEAGVSNLKNVELALLAEAAICDASAEAEEAGVRVESSLSQVSVRADAVLMRQLLSNLVQNAIRHNERGGTARVRVSSDGDASVVIEVTNSGEVITQEVADQLVDPFYRGRGRTNDASNRGRGLGLSIVSAIVSRHEGSLAVVPVESGGLKVRVILTKS